MSTYTTGQLAKQCGVTVRTVQYYDTRGILSPTGLSEGGRRLYSEEDRKRLEVICFLRGLGLPIDAISKMLSEENPERVITLLLGQQKQALREEIGQQREKLEKLESLQRGLKNSATVSVESIGDIAYTMSSKNRMKKIRLTLLLTALPLLLLEIGSILLWIFTGQWWLFAAWIAADILYAVFLTRWYLRSVAYLCPQCHTVFKPKNKEAIFAAHTPSARKLTCTCCGYRGFCVEVPAEEVNEK